MGRRKKRRGGGGGGEEREADRGSNIATELFGKPRFDLLFAHCNMTINSLRW